MVKSFKLHRSRIVVNASVFRKHSQKDIDSLWADIKVRGMLSPLIVKPLRLSNLYVLVGGYRRFLATTGWHRYQTLDCVLYQGERSP